MAHKEQADSAAVVSSIGCRAIVIAGVLVSAQAIPEGARAADLCAGDYVSTVLHPPPAPLIVVLTFHGGSDIAASPKFTETSEITPLYNRAWLLSARLTF